MLLLSSYPWHQLPNDPWYSMTQFILPAEISQCAFWMCDIMETISGEMLHSVQNLSVISSRCQSFCLSKIPRLEWKSPTCKPHCCLLPCKVRSSCVPLPLVISMDSLSPVFFHHDVKSNCEGFFPTSLIKRASSFKFFHPRFSLGSLPGKQETHLNQRKMCLMVWGSTAPLCPAILQRYKILQPRQLETSDWTTIMRWGVKYACNGREDRLITVETGRLLQSF